MRVVVGVQEAKVGCVSTREGDILTHVTFDGNFDDLPGWNTFVRDTNDFVQETLGFGAKLIGMYGARLTTGALVLEVLKSV